LSQKTISILWAIRVLCFSQNLSLHYNSQVKWS